MTPGAKTCCVRQNNIFLISLSKNSVLLDVLGARRGVEMGENFFNDQLCLAFTCLRVPVHVVIQNDIWMDLHPRIDIMATFKYYTAFLFSKLSDHYKWAHCLGMDLCDLYHCLSRTSAMV